MASNRAKKMKVREEEFWINPCGFDENADESDKSSYKKDLYKNLESSAVMAFYYANNLKELMRKRYPSIDEMDRELLDPTNPIHTFLNIPDCKFEQDNILEFFNLLQKIAILLEVMMQDFRNDKEYRDQLTIMKQNIIEVLCSLHVVLPLKCEQIKNVRRHDLPEELKKETTKSVRMMRDIITINTYYDLLKKILIGLGDILKNDNE